MPEFWEEAFKDKQEMWGSAPTTAAILTAEAFSAKGFKRILIPGIGYGRNAQPFINKRMAITGIEISPTAIGLAKKHYGQSLKIHHGSVTDMPFDDQVYDGIFCHALIHLLDQNERIKLIADCYHQLAESGMMLFTAISKAAPTFGQGRLVGKNRYEQFGGVNLFFYDEHSIQEEFGNFGPIEVDEIIENYPFYSIQCSKRYNAIDTK